MILKYVGMCSIKRATPLFKRVTPQCPKTSSTQPQALLILLVTTSQPNPICSRTRLNTMRKVQACRQCRETKRKCHFELGQQTCAPCLQRSLVCSKAPSGPHVLRPATPRRFMSDAYMAAANLVVDIPDNIVINLVKNYLMCIHNKPHVCFIYLRCEIAFNARLLV